MENRVENLTTSDKMIENLSKKLLLFKLDCEAVRRPAGSWVVADDAVDGDAAAIST